MESAFDYVLEDAETRKALSDAENALNKIPSPDVPSGKGGSFGETVKDTVTTAIKSALPGGNSSTSESYSDWWNYDRFDQVNEARDRSGIVIPQNADSMSYLSGHDDGYASGMDRGHSSGFRRGYSLAKRVHKNSGVGKGRIQGAVGMAAAGAAAYGAKKLYDRYKAKKAAKSQETEESWLDIPGSLDIMESYLSEVHAISHK